MDCFILNSAMHATANGMGCIHRSAARFGLEWGLNGALNVAEWCSKWAPKALETSTSSHCEQRLNMAPAAVETAASKNTKNGAFGTP